MRALSFILAVLLCASAVAEESSTTTLATGIIITEQSISKSETTQSVRISKFKSSYVVLVNAFMLCSGPIEQPWLGTGANPTLVIQKQSSPGPFHSGEECMYRLKVAIDASRLTSKQTLYVVSSQEVVGNVGVP
jgi:hypothetical protein